MKPSVRNLSLIVLAGFFAGCGGGGGTSTGGGSLTCGPTFKTPNYVESVDPSSNQQNTLRYWPSFPIQVFIENEVVYDNNGTIVSTDDLTETAINRWIAAAENAGIITLTNNEAAAEITVQFAQLNQKPGSGGTLARTVVSFFPSNNQLVSAEITVNLWPNMTAAEFTEGLIQTITHEFGHALYLQGHSEVDGDTMYFQSDPSEDGPLTTRDINSFQTAYCGEFTTRNITRSNPDEQPVTEVITCH